MDTLLQIISTSALTGLITSSFAIWYTRKNLKTTKFIETITAERIRWIQIVRNDLTELVSSVLIHLKNTDYLKNLTFEQERREYSNYVVSREPDSFTDDELEEYADQKMNISNSKKAFSESLTRFGIVKKATLLKLRFNPEDDIDIINYLNLIIENFADYSKPTKDININIKEFTEKSQQVLKKEWDKVKREVSHK